MRHRSPHRPHCRQCNKPIRKWTDTVYPAKGDCRSKADCQKLTNQSVVSVSYWVDGSVMRFSTWDGESYDDPYFCSGKCAEIFGYRAAKTLFK